jgi:hypothetical protein
MELADMALELYKGTLLAYHLGWLKDEKGCCGRSR